MVLPFTAELLRKEQSHDLKHKQKRDTAGGQYRKSDLSKLREKGLARQKEMEERLARDARRREEVDQLRESLASRTSICGSPGCSAGIISTTN